MYRWIYGWKSRLEEIQMINRQMNGQMDGRVEREIEGWMNR